MVVVVEVEEEFVWSNIRDVVNKNKKKRACATPRFLVAGSDYKRLPSTHYHRPHPPAYNPHLLDIT